MTPEYYVVGGRDAMGFITDALDRDADIETPGEAFARGCALKYLIRAPRKGGASDYLKCADLCMRLAEARRERP